MLRTFLPSLVVCTALAGGPPKDRAACCAEPAPCGLPAPLTTIHRYLCGFHFYNGDPARQLTAHHYCAPVGPDLMQCLVYDGSHKEARLVGIEYIITAKLFRTFPEDEKKLWHSHRFEVKSGQLVAPGLTEAADKALMKDLVLTYGKTWQTWQVDRNDQVPMGIPQLLMGFTGDGQIEPRLVVERDRALGVDTAARKAGRADLPAGAVEPGADAWQKGEAVQLGLIRAR